MIGMLVGAVAELGWQALERAWGHRRFSVGPPTDGFTSALFGGTAVNRGQVGLDVSWQGDDEGLVTRFTVGPLELWLHLAGFDASALDPELDLSREWVIRSQDGTELRVQLFALVNHVGVRSEWCRQGGRLLAGPLGVVVERSGEQGHSVDDLNARAAAREAGTR